MVDNEKKWMRCKNQKNEYFLITTKSELDRTMYFLYKLTDSGWKKISSDKNPSNFEDIIFEETK